MHAQVAFPLIKFVAVIDSIDFRARQFSEMGLKHLQEKRKATTTSSKTTTANTKAVITTALIITTTTTTIKSNAIKRKATTKI